ncbi:cupin domain-containing protein [Roseomonas sp. OT10]|uniref:cupin domain-containing protein n=1 Tax=Roseomonas cutis TaxID=2897332 RepID=UPI001E3915A3|nr:cupin domain-containing protein [Roseomonas sp. OT10]UFN47086.1 cupin domain-containing protein [Roseomonas sp. OT10]
MASADPAHGRGAGREGRLDNLFDHLPPPSGDEEFTELLVRPGVRIERIVSTGQVTPEDSPYDQAWDEWVLLLRGAARLWLEGQGERALRPGDHLLIPARCRHRVTWTDPEAPTVWLALHLGPP